MEKKGEILVSVCVPVFNGESYLSAALDSIYRQTFKDIEVIISDDDSSDQSLKIIESFKKKVDFPVRIFSHYPAGIGANWNYCITKASGKYIKFLFQDDVLFPTCIDKLVQVAEANPNIGLVSCKRKFLIEDEPNKDIKDWIFKYSDLQKHLTLGNHNIYYISKQFFRSNDFLKSPLNKIGEPTCVLFKKAIIEEIGFFRLDLEQILDYEFYYRILKTKQIAILNEELVGFRLHSQQTTNINRKRKIEDYGKYNYILYKDYFWLLGFKQQVRLLSLYNKPYKLIIRLLNVVKSKF